MQAHADVERILAHGLDHVLVGGNTGCFQGFGGDLLLLEGEEMHARGESVNRELLLSDIKDLDLGLGHTTAIARLDVRLVLDVTRAFPGTCPQQGRYS